MPRTEIFFGYAYRATTDGGISIEGKGDTAEITFRDHHRNPIRGTELKVYQLSKLEKLPLFKEAADAGTELLVNTWATKKTQYNIIKFATDKELAFVFTSYGNVEEDFLKLFEAKLPNIEYFKERELLKILNITMEQLRATPGMDNKKIKLLVNNIHSLSNLLKAGAAFEQIGLMDQLKLENLLEHFPKLNEALQFVSIQQILGLDHPLPVARSNENLNKYSYNNDFFGDFSCRHFIDRSEITHTNKTTEAQSMLTVQWSSLKDESVSQFKEKIKTLSPEKLVHNWYLLPEEPSNKIAASMYSPEINCLVQVSGDPQFPEKEFKEQSIGRWHAPYYREKDFVDSLIKQESAREKDFVDFLIQQKSSLTELKNLKGMSLIKIALLSQYKDRVLILLEKGVKFTDFAKIDEERLIHVLSHFNEAQSALKFVNVFELFGLGNTVSVSNYSPRMYRSAKKPEKQEDPEHSCTIA